MATNEAARIRTDLLGAWRLLAWQYVRVDGAVSCPVREDAVAGRRSCVWSRTLASIDTHPEDDCRRMARTRNR